MIIINFRLEISDLRFFVRSILKYPLDMKEILKNKGPEIS